MSGPKAHPLSVSTPTDVPLIGLPFSEPSSPVGDVSFAPTTSIPLGYLPLPLRNVSELPKKDKN